MNIQQIFLMLAIAGTARAMENQSNNNGSKAPIPPVNININQRGPTNSQGITMGSIPFSLVKPFKGKYSAYNNTPGRKPNLKEQPAGSHSNSSNTNADTLKHPSNKPNEEHLLRAVSLHARKFLRHRRLLICPYTIKRFMIVASAKISLQRTAG